MKKHLFYIPLFALFLVAVVSSCISDGDDDNGDSVTTFTSVSTVPEWLSDWLDAMEFNDAKPDWKLDNLSDYESFTVLVVRLEDVLITRSTNDDVMAVFVDGECRAVSPRNVTSDGVFFVLNVRGSSASDSQSEYRLSYYSGGLHHVFTLNETGGYIINEKILGADSDFSLPLTLGNGKFEAITDCIVAVPDDVPFTITEGDMVAAFIGNECRGLGKPNESFLIYSNNYNEQVQFRYYSAAKGGFYSDPTLVQLSEYGIKREFKF